MFEKSLPDLIRGIRANKNNEEEYISNRLQEIKVELRSTDHDIKANAIAKLCYLNMLGYEMKWASFAIVEVMSDTKLKNKRLGYLSAAITFDKDTEVLMLVNNLVRKDLLSSNSSEVSVAIDGLASFLNHELARDLFKDVFTLLSHSKPYIRKRATLLLFRVFMKYPDALRAAYPKLREKLDDTSEGVVASVISIVHELAKRNPKNFLNLAPPLFRMLQTCTNNWTLIKIVKIFALISPLEPRLCKKLIQPLSHIIETTSALSLLYESILAVVTGGILQCFREIYNHDQLGNQCMERLKIFLDSEDPNLKYIGIQGLLKIYDFDSTLVLRYRELVLPCIDDVDSTLRRKVLQLFSRMVNKENLEEIVEKLMQQVIPPNEESGRRKSQASPASATAPMKRIGSANSISHRLSMDASYTKEVIMKVVEICSCDNYTHLTNFEWYLGVLVDLLGVQNSGCGEVLSNQLIELSVRVPSVRPYAVEILVNMLNEDLQLQNDKISDEYNSEGLAGVGWILGEYSSLLKNPKEMALLFLSPLLLTCPFKVQSSFIHSSLKLLSTWLSSLKLPDQCHDALVTSKELLNLMEGFTISENPEVHDRAAISVGLLNVIIQGLSENNSQHAIMVESLKDLFFSYPLNPVNPKAQKKVPIPEGLNMDSWIYEPAQDEISEIDDLDDMYQEITGIDYNNNEVSFPSSMTQSYQGAPILKVEDIPIVKLELQDTPIEVISKEKKSYRKRGQRHVPQSQYVVHKGDGEMPSLVQNDTEEDDASIQILTTKGLVDEAQSLEKVDLSDVIEQEMIKTKSLLKKTLPEQKKEQNLSKDRKKRKLIPVHSCSALSVSYGMRTLLQEDSKAITITFILKIRNKREESVSQITAKLGLQSQSVSHKEEVKPGESVSMKAKFSYDYEENMIPSSAISCKVEYQTSKESLMENINFDLPIIPSTYLISSEPVSSERFAEIVSDPLQFPNTKIVTFPLIALIPLSKISDFIESTFPNVQIVETVEAQQSFSFYSKTIHLMDIVGLARVHHGQETSPFLTIEVRAKENHFICLFALEIEAQLRHQGL